MSDLWIRVDVTDVDEEEIQHSVNAFRGITQANSSALSAIYMALFELHLKRNHRNQSFPGLYNRWVLISKHKKRRLPLEEDGAKGLDKKL